MGVPAFFSWLVKRYPLSVHNLQFGQGPIVDCLYLDMNSILYKCAKDDNTVFKDLVIKKDFEELWLMIFNYINTVVNAVGPKKLLYLGLDGPAPRAKQNQQRTRRFLAAKGHHQTEELLRNQFNIKTEEEVFKNNSISPGTEFMYELNQQMQFFIVKKMEEDDNWKGLEVIFSGSDVPGEGEHKILRFIRDYAQQPSYDPMTSHCLYGPDADLIMLALSTHLPFVCIVRDEMVWKPKVSSATKRETPPLTFQIIYISVVREYMDLEFSQLKSEMKNKDFYDIEKIIDDFILLCFFIGNDFLPRCYCFNIREGNFEELIEQYKTMLKNTEQYINESGVINWKGLQKLLHILSKFERTFIEERFMENQKALNKQQRSRKGSKSNIHKKNYKEDDMIDESQEDKKQDQIKSSDSLNSSESSDYEDDQADRISTLNKYKAYDQQSEELLSKESEFLKVLALIYKDSTNEARKFYYKEKLNFDLDKNLEHVNEVDLMLIKYFEGLQFVLLYYYKDVPSFSWYYPFYYAPLTVDLYQFLEFHNKNQGFNIQFQKGEPYTPLKQLMCILHPLNSALLPKPIANLLVDKNSELRSPQDYYPDDYKVDPYGALFEHEFIVILPFMNEEKINSAFNKVDRTQLTPREQERDKLGTDLKFKYNSQPVAELTFKSTLPHYYTDIKSQRITVEIFKIDEVKLALKQHQFSGKETQNEEGKMIEEKNQSLQVKFPSLYIKMFSSSELREFTIGKKDEEKKFKKIMLNLDKEIDVSHFNQKMANKVQIGYPHSTACELVGWMSDSELVTLKKNDRIQLLNKYHYNRKSDIHLKVYKDLHKELQDEYFKLGIDCKKCQLIVFVRVYNQMVRRLDESVEYDKNYFQEFCVPDLMLMQSFEPRVQQQQRNKRYDGNSLISITKGQKAILSDQGERDGSLVEVRTVQQNFEKLVNNVGLALLKSPPVFDATKFITHNFKDKRHYFSMQFVGEKLAVSPQVLMEIIGSLQIQVDKSKSTAKKLPDVLDVGLNIYNKKNHQVVPNYATLLLGEKVPQKYSEITQLFNNDLAITEEVIEFLINFIQKCPKIVDAVEIYLKQFNEQDQDPQHQKGHGHHSQARRHDHHTHPLRAKDLYPSEEDANIPLVQLYIWILRDLPFSSLNFSSFNYEELAADQIKLLQSQIYQNQNADIQVMVEEISVNAKQIAPQDPYNYIPFCFKECPEQLKVGQRVIIVNDKSINSAPFGMSGTVVGIEENDYLVVSDSPFIGGTNLGGRCAFSRGLMIKFTDVYSLNSWNKSIATDSFNQEQHEQWNGAVPQYLFKHKVSLITDNKDYKLYRDKFQKPDIFSSH